MGKPKNSQEIIFVTSKLQKAGSEKKIDGAIGADRWGNVYLKVDGRLIVPFAVSRQWIITIDNLFDLTYGRSLQTLRRIMGLSKPNPFFSSIRKDPEWKGGLLVPVEI